MNIEEEIIKKFRALALHGDFIIAGKVVSVDKDNATCNVSDDNIEYQDVRLVSVIDTITGFSVIYPAVGSWVLISLIGSSETDGVVISYSEIDEIIINATKITLNEGSNKGLAKVEGLKSRLNSIESDINSLKNVLSSWTPVANDGGAALKTASSSWAGQQLEETVLTHIENDKILH